MKYAAGKHVYLLANLYNPAAYECAWLNCTIRQLMNAMAELNS